MSSVNKDAFAAAVFEIVAVLAFNFVAAVVASDSVVYDPVRRGILIVSRAKKGKDQRFTINTIGRE